MAIHRFLPMTLGSGTVPIQEYTLYVPSHQSLPSAVNFQQDFGPVEDQQNQDCTAFAGTDWFACLEVQAGKPWVQYSERAQYYAERALEGDGTADNGAQSWTIVKVLEQFGPMPLADDPYTPGDLNTPPPAHDWLKNLRLVPQQAASIPPIQNSYIPAMKDALAHRHPLLVAIVCFAEIEEPAIQQTGMLTMPANPSQSLGGHQIVACGYDDQKRFPDGNVGGVLLRNSWGPHFALQGYFWISYAYLNKYLCGAPTAGFPPNAYPIYSLTWEMPVKTATVGTPITIAWKTTTAHQAVTWDAILGPTQERLTQHADAQGHGVWKVQGTTAGTMTVTAHWIDPVQFPHQDVFTLEWKDAVVPAPPSATPIPHAVPHPNAPLVRHTITAYKTDHQTGAKEAVTWLREHGWTVSAQT